VRHENHAAIYAASPDARGGDGADGINNIEVDAGALQAVPGAA